MLKRASWLIATLSAVAVLVEAAPALAFDTGPHSELTNSAMGEEGFGNDAISLAEVNSWFNDLYEQAHKNPFSGHGSYLRRIVGVAIRNEDWSDALVSAASRLHFDNELAAPREGQMPSLGNTAGITAEWDRLRRATWTLVREARDEDDPAKALAVLGASLHVVQDFYSHTNWVEPRLGLGADGPGWQERGFGSNPTWFDIPAAEREKVAIYGDSTPGHSRTHGFWDADRNLSLGTAMGKDWPGRPLYQQAATTAYFASRQWIQAVRSWINDEAFWRELQSYRADQGELDHDLAGMFAISLYSGHWQGQGEPFRGAVPGPGGNLLELRRALKAYFQPDRTGVLEGIAFAFGKWDAALVVDAGLSGPTRYRKRYERLVPRLADRNPTGQLGPVPSSQDLQRTTQFVSLEVTSYRGESLGDPGPDEAEIYANVRIDGEAATSAVINGHDKFSFPRPNAPFEWLKAVPKVFDRGEPVETVEVEVKTADSRWAGTNDDVFLNLGYGLRFQLDKRLYDDFERGDIDTYSVPIDDATKNGFDVGDITQVKIEKSEDGIGGGWRLGGLKVRVNGRVISDTQNINRWLENDLVRYWTAKDFVRQDPRGPKVPIWIQLKEDDYFYGGDDEGDINPYDRRRTIAFGYTPGAPLEDSTKGGNKLAGRWSDGDTASLTYSLTTITPETISPIALPPAPVKALGPQPDLVVSAFDFSSITVTNRGAGPTDPFRVRAAGGSGEDTVDFAGLAPGASETRRLRLPCEGFYRAMADDLGQVAETDETNNEATSDPVIC